MIWRMLKFGPVAASWSGCERPTPMPLLSWRRHCAAAGVESLSRAVEIHDERVPASSRSLSSASRSRQPRPSRSHSCEKISRCLLAELERLGPAGATALEAVALVTSERNAAVAALAEFREQHDRAAHAASDSSWRARALCEAVRRASHGCAIAGGAGCRRRRTGACDPGADRSKTGVCRPGRLRGPGGRPASGNCG